MSKRIPPRHPVRCLVCMENFGDAIALRDPNRQTFHRLICRSCQDNRAYSKLYNDPEFKAAVARQWERQREKKEAVKSPLRPRADESTQVPVEVLRRFVSSSTSSSSSSSLSSSSSSTAQTPAA